MSFNLFRYSRPFHSAIQPSFYCDNFWQNLTIQSEFYEDFSDATGKAWSIFGGAVIDNGSLLIPDSSAYISTADHNDLDFGSGDFTIEYFIHPLNFTAIGGYVQCPISRGSGTDCWAVWHDASGYMMFVVSNTVRLSSASQNKQLNVNGFQHVAITRNANTLRIFINGELSGTLASLTNVLSTNTPLEIGRYISSPSGRFNGRIKGLRITKGVARYTAAFAPPTLPYEYPTVACDDPGNFTVNVMPTGGVTVMEFSPDDTYLAVGHYTAPFLTIYKRNGNTFTKLNTVTTPLTDRPQAISWSPDGMYLAVAPENTIPVFVLKRNSDTFTSLGSLPSLPSGQERGIAFSPNGNLLVLITSTHLARWTKSGDIFTKVPNDIALTKLPQAFDCISFHQFGNLCAVSLSESPYIHLYDVNGTDFTIASTPASIPAGPIYQARFSPNGLFMAFGSNASPRAGFYESVNGVWEPRAVGYIATTTASSCSWRTDSNRFAISTSSTVFIYEISTGSAILVGANVSTISNQSVAYGKTQNILAIGRQANLQIVYA